MAAESFVSSSDKTHVQSCCWLPPSFAPSAPPFCFSRTRTLPTPGGSIGPVDLASPSRPVLWLPLCWPTDPAVLQLIVSLHLSLPATAQHILPIARRWLHQLHNGNREMRPRAGNWARPTGPGLWPDLIRIF